MVRASTIDGAPSSQSVAGVSSHEERIRMALLNLRGEVSQPSGRSLQRATPSPLEPRQPELRSMVRANSGSATLRQAAEPPRVQIIRLSAEEESLPESDIQLEEEQEPPAGFGQDQVDLVMEGNRVRRYQHQPNRNLNARLTNLVLCALLFVIGLAVGHFVGSTHERFSHHFERVDRMDRIKSIQNELLLCAHKYDELELQLNDVKATLVQKEYVDKWESLYQEGEEEKAALTATMNLYKSRYNKQKQLLTQCEVKYQDLEEQLDSLKSRAARRSEELSQPACTRSLTSCQSRAAGLDRRVVELEARLANCSDGRPAPRSCLEQLLHLGANFSNFSSLVDGLGRGGLDLGANLTTAARDWVSAARASGNSSEAFLRWAAELGRALNSSQLAELGRASTLAVTDHVEHLFEMLAAAMRRTEGQAAAAGGGEGGEGQAAKASLYQRVSAKLAELSGAGGGGGGIGERAAAGIPKMWRRALNSTRALWRVGVSQARSVLHRLHRRRSADDNRGAPTDANGFLKRKLNSIGESPPPPPPPPPPAKERLWTNSNTNSTISPAVDRKDSADWFIRRADWRRSQHDTLPSADWYWRRRSKRSARPPPVAEAGADWSAEVGIDDVAADSWPDAFWTVQRNMRRAQQRLWHSLDRLSKKVAPHKWWDKRKRQRARARRREQRRWRRQWENERREEY